jgi:negative regulator of flagellin synthesis FlgM
MINSIGPSSTSLSGIGTHTTQRGEGAQRSEKPTSSLEDRAAVSTTVSQLAAQGAPIDGDRVAALRTAIKSGSYRADPQAISRAMISTDLGADL